MRSLPTVGKPPPRLRLVPNSVPVHISPGQVEFVNVDPSTRPDYAAMLEALGKTGSGSGPHTDDKKDK